MASITLKNLPEALHSAYKRRAKAHARSLQAEILQTLAHGVCAADDGGESTVEDVAGMLKPRKKGVTVRGMQEGIDESLRKDQSAVTFSPGFRPAFQ